MLLPLPTIMFTGLIEETGPVIWLRQRSNKGIQLAVEAAGMHREVKKGESIAVNGCCLTLTERRGAVLHFDLLQETLDKTNLKDLRPDVPVNLERCLTPSTRMGGHFVQGHVDCVSEVLIWEKAGSDWQLDVRLPEAFAGYVAYKGSIAVNGVSLTVAEVGEESFRVWIIPHTREQTNLRQLEPGRMVNLEFDLLAKYIERLLLTGRLRGTVPERNGEAEPFSSGDVMER